jgi:spermidine export protein MdtI
MSLVYSFYLTIAIVLEVIANVLMKLSNGFKYKIFAFGAIACVLTAFTALSFAIRGIPLTVAYGIWGGVGLIATTLLSMKMFGARLRLSAWVGIVLVIIGMLLMKLA